MKKEEKKSTPRLNMDIEKERVLKEGKDALKEVIDRLQRYYDQGAYLINAKEEEDRVLAKEKDPEFRPRNTITIPTGIRYLEIKVQLSTKRIVGAGTEHPKGRLVIGE